jgi:hypothetical protein
VASFSGRFISFVDVHTGPRPVRKPHPPIWVGGATDAALRRAVRYGTAWHPIRIRLDWLKNVGYPRLQEIAVQERKPLPELAPRISLQISGKRLPDNERVAGQGTLDQIQADLAELAGLGATYITLDTYSGQLPSLDNLDSHFEALAAVRSVWPTV